MPTRDEFLASPGLVPQITEAGTICAICYDEATNPVLTSGCECRVLYCRKCVLSWFEYGSNCPTCRVAYMSENDPNNVEGPLAPPTFGINATVRRFAPNGEGDEVIYLLDLDEMGDMDTPEDEQAELQHIHDFRFFDDEYDSTDESMTRQAWIDAYLLIDFLLAAANTFYEEQLADALEGSQGADENDFFLLVRTVGQMILDFHEQGMTFEECHQLLLQEVLDDLRHESPVFQELYNVIEAQGRMLDPNPLQRYVLYIVEQVAIAAERVYHFVDNESDDEHDRDSHQDQSMEDAPSLEGDYPPPYLTFGLPVTVEETVIDHFEECRHVYLLNSATRDPENDIVRARDLSEIRDYDEEEDDERDGHTRLSPPVIVERLALFDAPPLIDALLVHANTFHREVFDWASRDGQEEVHANTSLRERFDWFGRQIHKEFHAVVQSLGRVVISLDSRNAMTPDEARHELIDRAVNELKDVSPIFREMYQAHQEQRQLETPSIVQRYMLDVIEHMVEQAKRVYLYSQYLDQEADWWN
ncbi:hypothetical protein CB0940_11312 [Cercospora beticola]|uniref:RING-type domain-containing protein n=1 Tax=Cercospora beticola TaxID=122368 RepID=A0A2G5HDN5_CERBT|nr:hypothetical protein CB0940_11312 [Cercospora beticola]PIA90605.1 hypothetical protein CB0940_11312 [Cercospora beticola]WPB08150.1 hypothetical protein RHO25_012814 [Cercospora beticola]